MSCESEKLKYYPGTSEYLGVDDTGEEFLFPLRWRKKCPRRKFKIADDDTLTKILNTEPSIGRPEPEFQGKTYIPGINSEDKVLYKCNEPNCSAIFASDTSLKSHKIKHLNHKLKCQFCGMCFKTNDDRTSHLQQFHPDLERFPHANPLQCKKCGKIPRDRQALWRHVRESHPGPPTPCPHCGVLFNRIDNMKEHIKKKHPPEGNQVEKHSCEVCGKEFLYKNTLRGHIRKLHREKPRETFRCVICNTKYSCKESYNNHMKLHINPTYFPCHICNVKFRNQGKLNRHFKSLAHKRLARRKRRPSSPQKDIVPFKIKTVSSLASERLTREELIKSCHTTQVKIILHRVDENKVQYNFTGNPTLKRISNGTYLNCMYCSLSLPDVEAVTRHEAICYLNIKSRKTYICTHEGCDREFEKAYKLKLHLRCHSNERPFPCSFCDKSYKSRNIKMHHEKTAHFGIRPERAEEPQRTYQCNYEGCKKEYTTAKSLQTHVKGVHLKVRFTCETCGKVMRRKDKYSEHMREEHLENTGTPTLLLLCKPCKRSYKTRAAMLTHLKTRRHLRKSKEYQRSLNRASRKERKKKSKTGEIGNK